MPSMHIGLAPRERVRRFYRALEKGDMDGIRANITPDLINKAHMVKDERRIPLHIAAKKGHFDAVLFLIEKSEI